MDHTELLSLNIVGQGPTVLSEGAGTFGYFPGMFGCFLLRLSSLFSFSLSLGDCPIQTSYDMKAITKNKAEKNP